MLIYIGNGEWKVGLPARDLTDAEVETLGGEKRLIATGLYKRPPAPKAEKKAEHLTPAKESEK
jgi:hypothetical protein